MEESHRVAEVREAEETVANEANEQEENTGMEDEEFVPEMAEGCNRFVIDLVEEVDSVPNPLIPLCVCGLVRLREGELEKEGAWPALGNPGLKEIDKREGGMRGLGSSGDKDIIIGGMIVAGGASQKAKNAARRGKRKSRWSKASSWNGGW